MSIRDDFSKVDCLLENNMGNYLGNPLPRIFDSQPKNASWVSVDIDFGHGSALEQQNVIGYRSSKDMAHEVVEFVREVFTPELLQLVRDGTIENLSFRIGPRTIASTDLNYGMGIENRVFDKRSQKVTIKGVNDV